MPWPRVLAAGVCAFVSWASAGAEPPRSAQVTLEYAGTVFSLPVMRVRAELEIAGGAYRGATTFRSTAIGGLFKSERVESRAAGRINGHGPEPAFYQHVEHIGRRQRAVALSFLPSDVRVIADPPFRSAGDPPATPAQKREALDPIAAVLAILMDGGDNPCDRRVPIFDSRFRYDLLFAPAGIGAVATRGWKGEAMRCAVFYVPIAGYETDELGEPEAYAGAIDFWLAEIAPDLYAPVRVEMQARAAFFTIDAHLELTRWEVVPLAPSRG